MRGLIAAVVLGVSMHGAMGMPARSTPTPNDAAVRAKIDERLHRILAEIVAKRTATRNTPAVSTSFARR